LRMNSNLQQKLQEFSAEPPQGVWDKIADALDADGLFAQRLYQYEEPPPVAAWEEIEKSLSVSAPVKNVSFITRFKKPLRYAAVACIIAVALVTITLTVKRTEAGSIEAGSHAKITVRSTVPSNTAPGQATDSPVPAASSQESKPGLAGEPNGSVASAESGAGKTTQAVYSSLNEYVLFNDGDGRTRRVSKKLADLVRCKDSNVACQQRLQRLRRKLAANAMTTDFTGILEMLRQLQ
jgi:hypothetical protein